MPGKFHAGRIEALQGVFLLRGQEDKIARLHVGPQVFCPRCGREKPRQNSPAWQALREQLIDD